MARGVTSISRSLTTTPWQVQRRLERLEAALSSSAGAADVGIEDTAGYFTATDVEGALAELTGLLVNNMVYATIAVANAGGGATGAAMTLQLKQLDGSTNITVARQVFITTSSTQYQGLGPPQASLTLGTVTAGSIIATVQAGACWLVQTSATGAFACTATNTDDETIWFSVMTPTGGVSDVTKGCIVVGSNADSATWSA